MTESRAPQTHELKCDPYFFDDVASGVKPFEIRRFLNNDMTTTERDFQVGDTLHLREYDRRLAYSSSKTDPMAYTGRECRKVVTSILDDNDYGLQDGFCILGLAPDTDEVKTLQAQNVQLREALEWLPIATAPKTGPCTDLLLFVPGLHGTKGVVVGHWADGGGEEQPRFRGWFFWSGLDFRELHPNPTHWMPLPDPPSALSQSDTQGGRDSGK